MIMTNTNEITLPEDFRTISFRDKRTLITRVIIVLSLVIFILATAMVTFALRGSIQKQSELTKLLGLTEAQGGDLAVARQIYDAIEKIGKLTKLPEEEVPIFATVADVEKLREQSIFKDANNGDYILYYTKAQWMYIYRVQEDRIIAQGPFILPDQKNAPQSSPVESSDSQMPDVPVAPSTDENEMVESSPEMNPADTSAPPEASPETLN